MQSDSGLQAIAVGWALIWGLLAFPFLLGLAFVSKRPTIRRMRWVLVALFFLYLVAMFVLLRSGGSPS